MFGPSCCLQSLQDRRKARRDVCQQRHFFSILSVSFSSGLPQMEGVANGALRGVWPPVLECAGIRLCLSRPFCLFALSRTALRAPKSRKRRKEAFSLRYPRICSNLHFLNSHLRHPNSFTSGLSLIRDILNHGSCFATIRIATGLQRIQIARPKTARIAVKALLFFTFKIGFQIARFRFAGRLGIASDPDSSRAIRDI